MDDAVPVDVDVAVVGGGPSGLAAAAALRRRGIGTVVVFEREPEAGGIPRNCAHPPYGIREFRRLMTGPTYAARLRRMADEAGVDVRVRNSVVALGPGGRLDVASPEGAQVVRARRVILATGARESPRSSRLLSGERPIGVVNTGALQSYIHLKHLLPFRRPVIVGTELVGLSAVWTCVSHGIRPVAVVEEGRRSTARWPLGLFPRLLGIPVHYGARIVAVGGRTRVEHVDIADGEGRAIRLLCDGLLLTGGFLPEASLMRMGAVAVDPGSGGPMVDQYGRASDPAYFVAGNLLRPVENAGWCFMEGRKAGETVADDLAGLLPPPASSLPIRRGPNVKLTVPQVLALPVADAPVGHIQVRVAGEAHGRLVVRVGNAVLWSRRIRTRPERRILIPLAGIAWPGQASSVEIGIEPAS